MLEITLIGYGNQGRAWAANLRDSGWKVKVSGRAGEEGGLGLINAARDGFEVVAPADLHKVSGIIALLLPDEVIPHFFNKYLASPPVGVTRSFIFAHGFSVVFGKIPFQEFDEIILVAPKGIGTKLRQNYLAGSGVMGVLAVAQDTSQNAWQKARQIANGLGCDRVGIVETTVRGETFADLLSEQAILCGAVPALVKKSVDFLVAKGIDPRLATYECLHELKLIVDMMVEFGIEGMFKKVSRTAHFGGILAKEAILPESELNAKLEGLWQKIEDGSFSAGLNKEAQNNYPEIKNHYLHLENNLVDKNL